jgi:hypothetical protein
MGWLLSGIVLPHAFLYNARLTKFSVRGGCEKQNLSQLSSPKIKAVSILTGRDTDFKKWSVEWPTNV